MAGQYSSCKKVDLHNLLDAYLPIPQINYFSIYFPCAWMLIICEEMFTLGELHGIYQLAEM